MILADKNLRLLLLVLVSVLLVLLGVAFMPQLEQLGLPRLRLALVGLSALSLGLGVWAVRWMHRRVERLTRVATAIGAGDYSTRVEEEGAGALSELSSALNRLAHRTQTVVEDLEAREEQLHQLTTHDLLTGLANRRLFFELLVKEMAHAKRAEQVVGVAMFDLDRFKDFNESLGTVWGDRILQRVAQRLRGVTREADTLARIGSDEFGLIVTRASRAHDVVEAALRVFSSLDRPIELGDKELLVAASGGVGVFPQDGSEPETVIRCANSAVSWAKARGGKTCQRYEAFMERHSEDRLELEQEFPRALRDGQFFVTYQPQIAVADGSLVGMEALVRWQHPRRGRLTAGSFIPLLEQTTFMPALGEWLLDEICRQSSDWQRRGSSGVPVSVNVSVRQFGTGNLAEIVTAALEAHHLDPRFLQLEITESIAMHDIEQITRVLDDLNRLGIRIHLDDFGTGYSSLAYLMRFPVDVLKIDRSFVTGLPDNSHGAAIVRATIALARSLDLSVVAEGVETVGQLRFLRAEDCDAAQGFLFGEPLLPEEMETVMREGRLALPAPCPADLV